MATLLYLNNPADRTVTWGGVTITYERIEQYRRAGMDPWTGIARPVAPYRER